MAKTIATFRSDADGVSTPTNAAKVATPAWVTRALLTCGVVAGPLFVVVAIFEILTRPGYDFGRHPISLLSLGDFGWIQIANFVGSGLLTIGFAVGARRVLLGGPGRNLGNIVDWRLRHRAHRCWCLRPRPGLGFPTPGHRLASPAS